jgi:hypothetical protein
MRSAMAMFSLDAVKEHLVVALGELSVGYVTMHVRRFRTGQSVHPETLSGLLLQESPN